MTFSCKIHCIADFKTLGKMFQKGLYAQTDY
jgi:hypothetical protein